MNNQLIAYDKFKKLKVGALFMEMGTGKTKVAIDLINYNNVDLAIFVVPFSTKENLNDEIIKWKLNCEYIIIGYETISSSDSKYLKLLNLLKNKKCFIVADESTFIKNEETKRFKRLIKIRENCDYALILNGTPITKNEWDLYNQIYFLSPKIIDMSREQFLNTFFKHIIYKKKYSKKNDFYIFSEINAEYLQKLIEPYIFKCKLYFDKDENTVINYIEYDNNEYYKEKEYHLKKVIENQKVNQIINMLNILNKISSTYVNKNNKVIQYIRNKKVIVFCNYLEEVEYIYSRIDGYKINGNIKNRQEIINNFKNNNKPLIMTFGTGSFGLNLQDCNEIVYSSVNFNYALLEQSKARIRRIGQNKNIKYTYFLTDLGITKFILDNINKKTTLNNLIKEKIKKGDIKWLKNI